MNISIRYRIYLSFTLLVLVFVVNGIITVAVINGNRKLSDNVSTIYDPSIQGLHEFRNIMLQSQMQATNWVFIRSNIDDKNALIRLHGIDYPLLKRRLEGLSAKWNDKAMSDSLLAMLQKFESVLKQEKQLMNMLVDFKDYDDPVKKFMAEETIETVILPRTAELMASLHSASQMVKIGRSAANAKLENSALFLNRLITAMSLGIIVLGICLSFYLSGIILTPVRHIGYIINNLGKGITGKVKYKARADEIGEMVQSVNILSEKLQAAATFAQQVGNRNFSIPFQPLSNKDTLGMALLTMRDKLRIADENLKEVQHIAMLGSWERDLHTNKVVLSDELCRIFDLDATDAEQDMNAYLQMIHPDDAGFVSSLMQKYIKDHQPVSYQCRIVTAHKKEKIIYAKAQVVLNENGEVEKTFGIVQDITARKHAETALMASEYRMRTILESTPECIKLLSADNKLLEINPAGLSMIEADSAEQAVGMDITLLVAEHYRNDFISLSEKVFKGEQGRLQFEIIGLKGTKRWMETHAVPLKDSSGKVISLLGITRDITLSKLAEFKLKQSEKHSRNLFDQSTVGLVLAHMDGTLADVNEAYSKLIGYDREEIKNLTYWEITPEKYNIIEKEKLEELKKYGRYSPYEKEYMRKDGLLVPVRMSGIIIEKEGEKFILSSVEDITETRRAHEVLLKKNNELQKTNSELDKFVYSVSHDLRAPLTSMLGVIEISQEETTEPQMLEHLDMLNSGIKKLDGFILDILDYSRNARQDIRTSDIDFRELLDEVISSLRYMGDHGKLTQISTSVTGSGTIVSDRSRLTIILNNLISNGIRYKNPQEEQPFVHVNVETKENGAVISISDNGLGIRKEYHSKIFEMFYRVSENSVGSGLGLYIVKEAVEKLRGTINLQSEPGKGSTFTVCIPATK